MRGSGTAWSLLAHARRVAVPPFRSDAVVKRKLRQFANVPHVAGFACSDALTLAAPHERYRGLDPFLIFRLVGNRANLPSGTDNLTSELASLRPRGDLLGPTDCLAALLGAGKADGGADGASPLGARGKGNAFDERAEHSTQSTKTRVADRNLLPGRPPGLGLHELSEVLPPQTVVELLALGGPPVDATLTDEEPASNGFVRVDDYLGVTVHDRALGQMEVERVCGHAGERRAAPARS